MSYADKAFLFVFRKEVKMKSTKKSMSVMKKKNNRAGFLFILPLIIIFAVFLGYSFYFLLKNSFYIVDISFKNPEFFGLNNYKNVLSDDQFYRALFNNFLLSSANIFFGITIGFLVAVFLKLAIVGKKFFHALFFVPSMLPIALMAAVFNSMMQYKEGTINNLLRAIGLGNLAQRWIVDPHLAMPSVMSVSIFLIGIPIMYYTADLTTISASILEAASIDGAKLRHILGFILFPMMKNTHKTIILSMLLGGFREMDRVYLMTDGGPGGVTEIIGTYIFRAARAPGANLGKVCAVAVIIMCISFLIGFIHMKLNNLNSLKGGHS